MSALECLFLSLSPPSFISERPPNINRYQSDVTQAGTNTMCHLNLNTFVQVDVHVGVNQPCWYNGGRGTDGSQGKALNFHVDAVALFLFLSYSSWMLIVSVPLQHSLPCIPSLLPVRLLLQLECGHCTASRGELARGNVLLIDLCRLPQTLGAS